MMAPPPDERATVAAPTTSGASPNRLEIRTLTALPPRATVDSSLTVVSLAITPGCAQAMGEPQATLQTSAAGFRAEPLDLVPDLETPSRPAETCLWRAGAELSPATTSTPPIASKAMPTRGIALRRRIAERGR